MEVTRIAFLTALFLTLQLVLPVSSQASIQGRRARPYNPDNCDRYGRCSDKDGRIDASSEENYKSDQDKDEPVGVRPGTGAETNPKPLVNKDDYEPKFVAGAGGSVGFKPKPVVDRDDYETKPVASSVGGSHSSQPSGARDGYDPKPAVSSGSGGYSKPAVDTEGYDSKHSVSNSGSGVYVPRPVPNRDEYDSKPSVSSSGVEEYKPVPVVHRDGYESKPVVTGSAPGYNRKPEENRGVYDSKPIEETRDVYYPKPVVHSGDYRPSRGDNRKPVVDDDNYKPVSTSGSGGGYNRRPVVSGGGYNPRPVIDDDDKPSGGYNPKPNQGGRGTGRYIPRPVDDRDEYIPKPTGGIGGGGYRPKPVDEDRVSQPVRGDDRPYRRPGKTDLGGYENVKDDYYNNDYEGYDLKDDEFDDESKPSRLADGNCICVPYYQCTDGHIVTDGSGIIDARKRPDPDEDLPLSGKFNPPSCGPFHVCCNTPESSTVKPYEHRCGVRNPSGINSRILSPSNKGEADFGEWPWQAAVLKAEGTVNIFQCGGVLIDKYHVVTVAHCVFHLYQYNEYPVKVRLGEWDTQTSTEFLAHADYKVAKIIVHPEYRNTSLWNDIAVLRLESPVLFAPHIDTVCLPQYDEIFAGQNCVVTGWGKDAYKGGTFSNVMKEVAIQVIDNYKCEEMLRKTRLGRFFQLHEGFLCAGGEYGLDSCKGDGGGPLVCYRKDKSYALAGIVSWGIDCGQPGVPGVYIKIQKYLNWISKTTGVVLEEYWPRH